MSTIKVDTYLTRGGASEIAIDKLKGVSSAGSMIVVGEGGSTTTNLQQGLAKHWNQFVQSNASVADSFNQSSATDEGTGDTSWDFTNAMGNDDYSSQTTCNSGSYQFTSSYNDAQKTTAGDRCFSMTAASGVADATTVFVTTHGDLA